MNRKRLLTPAVLALGAVIALGCGLGDAETGVTNDAEPAASGSAGDDKGGKPNTAPAAFAKQTKTIGDKLVVSTSTPEPWSPPAINSGHTAGNKAFRVSVTFTNNGEEPVEGTLMQYTGTMGKDGTACEQVYADGVNTSAAGVIQPGRKATVRVGFSCPTKDTSIVGVQVTSGFSGAAADFEGALKK